MPSRRGRRSTSTTCNNQILHTGIHNNGSGQCIYVLINDIFFHRLDIKIKTIAPFNHKSLQAEHGIKSLTCILTKHITGLGQMWTKYLSLAMFAYNTFNSPNLGNYSPYELIFGRKPTLLLNVEKIQI